MAHFQEGRLGVSQLAGEGSQTKTRWSSWNRRSDRPTPSTEVRSDNRKARHSGTEAMPAGRRGAHLQQLNRVTQNRPLLGARAYGIAAPCSGHYDLTRPDSATARRHSEHWILRMGNRRNHCTYRFRRQYGGQRDRAPAELIGSSSCVARRKRNLPHIQRRHLRYIDARKHQHWNTQERERSR